MHYQQRRCLSRLPEFFTRIEEESLDVDEVTALFFSSSEIRDCLLDEGVEEAVAKVKKKYKKPPKPKVIVFDKESPSAPPFTSPDHMAPITTKSVFNQQMAQAVTPYVTAIADKIAEERGLKPPDKYAIEKVLEKVDWTRAAYELNGLGKKPPKSQLIKFLEKYIWNPLDRAFDRIPFKAMWVAISGISAAYMIYASFASSVEALLNPLARASARYTRHATRQGLRHGLKRSGFRVGRRFLRKWV